MFEKLKEIQAKAFENQFTELQKTCDNYPAIAEFVTPIIAYGSGQAYCGGSAESILTFVEPRNSSA